MALIKLTPFGGLLPKIGTRLLPDNAAVVANNIKLQSGEIRPLRRQALVNTPTKPLPAETIYQARNGEASAWLSWPFDVDVVRVPLAAEVESRFVWTGDGEPKIGTYSNAVDGGGGDYPHTYYSLGVPAPITVPTVTPSGGVGAATTRAYTYTFFSELGEESASAPASALVTGKVDDTWAITAMDAVPPNSGNVTDITYIGNSVTVTSDVTHYNRVGEDVTIAGVTTVTNVNGTWTLTAADSAAKTMTFTVTDAPSGTYVDATDTTDTWARKTNWNTAGMKRRLYRSTGSLGTIQLVDDDVGTTYNDTVTDANLLGDELISSAWALPPVGLRGVDVHSSGALVGFVGNLLCFSEPLQPHAWPVEYQLSTEHDIVGVGAFGSEVGVGTSGNPYVASGTDPASMAFQKLDGMYPCLSKRSLIGFGDGLIYASAYGLVYAGQSGVNIFTEQFYSRDEWQGINPATMVCASAYGRLYVAHQLDDGARSMLIFDEGILVTADVPTYALYADSATSEVFVSDADGIKSWDDADSYPLNANWRSKDFVLPTPVNLGAAKIEFDSAVDEATQSAINAAIAAATATNTAMLATGSIGGAINSQGYNEGEVSGTGLTAIPDNPPSNQVTFVLRKNQDEIVMTRVVSNNRAFRLPAGYKADTFSVEVFSQCRIREIRLAETLDGLRGA